MTKLQAENASLSGPIIASAHSGAEGLYVDFKNKTEDFIEWTVDVAIAGTYDLAFRYANGASNRPLDFAVNGTSQVSSLDFDGTNSWNSWELVTQQAALQAGTNTVRLTATGKSGPNFDWLQVSDATALSPVNVVISDASATEGTDSYLSFNVGLSTASNENVVLDLFTTDGTAKGGLTSNFDPLGLVDYDNQAFEFSSDGGSTWQAAFNGTEVTFEPNQTILAVRLAVNDDTTEEGSTPETLSLGVATVLSGTVDDATDTGSGAIVDNDSSSIAQPPDQIHLAWVNDPASTMTVVWRTLTLDVPSTVNYREIGETSWQTATGALRTSGTTGTLHEVTLTGLTPSTAYEYRVQGDGSGWSNIYQTRTAPASGPSDFTAIYVADTGLVGRTDGLTTGTQQVIDEIDELDPLLILGGGDYAYYNTETRFSQLDDAIDEWFNQWQPVLTESPVMPTYGNHEVILGEGFESWAARFPTPEGLDSRQNYSFDVGDVHFVSILAVQDIGGVTDERVNWVEQDILAAQARGQRWIIPYFHAGPFSNGINHGSNIEFRKRFGPLFERLDVDLAIYSHDQAYERTYPLANLPPVNKESLITPTSLSLTNYTKEDGVVFVKTSPGGKLSNKNGGFSPFANETPQPYIAFRDNTMHHFSQLTVAAEGSLRLDTYGLIGDGSPPVIIDSFQITDGPSPVVVTIADTSVSEAAAAYLTFDIVLSSASTADITLNLATVDGSATGGSPSEFDSAGAVDYANQDIEVSSDGGSSWQLTNSDHQITFSAGQTSLKVRLAVNDDLAVEEAAETMTLGVDSVVLGNVDDYSDTGIGNIIDNDSDNTDSSIRVEAESLADSDIVSYRLEAVGAASGSQVLSLRGSAGNEIGVATVDFTASEGVYDVLIGTFDENDGLARFELTHNDSLIGSATLDQQLGSGSANAQTFVELTLAQSIQLGVGDVLTITGFEEASEHARLDYIEFVPSNLFGL
ncbi:MAG: fibronectin type III domain-containing protein [Phormidesmis sp.]